MTLGILGNLGESDGVSVTKTVVAMLNSSLEFRSMGASSSTHGFIQ